MGASLGQTGIKEDWSKDEENKDRVGGLNGIWGVIVGAWEDRGDVQHWRNFDS